jgi:inhibitor of KinA sporulation pathway (predicted exonuclease)
LSQCKRDNVSFLHLNVQSLKPKLDLISAEYGDFDMLSFTETWLNHSTPDRDIKLDSINVPLRKERVESKTLNIQV